MSRSFGARRGMRLVERSHSRRGVTAGVGQKRGPKTAYVNAELAAEIRAALALPPSVGEGKRKVWARLRI